MRINDSQVRDFFLKHGVLATLRRWPYEKKLGKVITVTFGPFDKVGAIVKEVLFFPRPHELERYVSISSFKTVDEWWKRALELHHGKHPTRLVVIELYKPKPRVPKNIPGLKVVKHV